MSCCLKVSMVSKKIRFTIHLNKIIFLASFKGKSFDLNSIRDNFRQHIQTRRNTDAADLVLLDDDLIQNLLNLKQEAFKILQKSKDINCLKKKQEINTFSSFQEFVTFVVNQEEILNSELWKLEAIYNYLDEHELINPPQSNETYKF